jgi:hypothetical protein
MMRGKAAPNSKNAVFREKILDTALTGLIIFWLTRLHFLDDLRVELTNFQCDSSNGSFETPIRLLSAN